MYAAGFGDFMASLPSAEFRRAPGVLRALGERWWDMSSSFHLSFGEMTMTPMDFTALTGITVGGTLIMVDRGVSITDAGMRDALGTVLRSDRGEAVLMSDLHEHLMAVPDPGEDARRARQYARCLILAILGDCLVSSGSEAVHLWWLPLLMDFRAIRALDWGGLGLAELYRSMSLYSRWLSSSFTGFGYLWQVYMHFN